MLLTFSVLYDKLLNKQKTQTIRLNWKRWYKWVCNQDERMDDCLLQIYWKNPRNGGKKMGVGKILDFDIKSISELTLDDAIFDGFNSLEELKEALFSMNPELNGNSDVAVINWLWTDGPYDVKVV